MTITGIITAILIGIVVGVLGRLLVPGKQPIGMLVTILVGIVSAFIGTAIARALGIPTATNGIDWLELLVQVIVAALGVALVASLMGRRRTGLRDADVPACFGTLNSSRSRLTPAAGIAAVCGPNTRQREHQSVHPRAALICWTTHALPSGSANPNSVPPSRSSMTSISSAATPRATSSSRARYGIGDDELRGPVASPAASGDGSTAARSSSRSRAG